MKRLLVLLFPAVLGIAARPAPGAPLTFPQVEGRNLQGTSVTLPDDFGGDWNLVLVAFERGQQQQVDTWFPAAERWSERFPAFRYYELPTISPRNRFTRWMIHRGMRSGIPDEAARERTITLYLEKPFFRAALNLPHEETIYALLMDGSGAVRWSGQGVFDEAQGEAVEALLNPTGSR